MSDEGLRERGETGTLPVRHYRCRCRCRRRVKLFLHPARPEPAMDRPAGIRIVCCLAREGRKGACRRPRAPVAWGDGGPRSLSRVPAPHLHDRDGVPALPPSRGDRPRRRRRGRGPLPRGVRRRASRRRGRDDERGAATGDRHLGCRDRRRDIHHGRHRRAVAVARGCARRDGGRCCDGGCRCDGIRRRERHGAGGARLHTGARSHDSTDHGAARDHHRAGPDEAPCGRVRPAPGRSGRPFPEGSPAVTRPAPLTGGRIVLDDAPRAELSRP